MLQREITKELKSLDFQQPNMQRNSRTRDNSQPSRTSTNYLQPINNELPQNVILSNDPRAAEYNPPAPVPCEYCGAPRYTRGILFTGRRVCWMPTGPQTCECEQAQAAKREAEALAEAERIAKEQAEARAKELVRIERIIGTSGLGDRFKNRTFEKFNTEPDNITAYKTARGYADNFAKLMEREKNGLVFAGPPGTGKTHLAASVANQLMNTGVPVIFTTMIDLLSKIKATFDTERTTANEADVMRSYKTVDLLIIDDMGKEQPTNWALTKMYEIINARYENYKPVIITTNYSAEELTQRLTPKDGDSTTAAACIDRILESTYTVALAGESWRRRN